MISHITRTYPQCLSYLSNRARVIFSQLKIPEIPVVPESKLAPTGVRARFRYSGYLRIEVSRQLIDLVADSSQYIRVWSILNGLRHEIHHYCQYLSGIRDFTDKHEEEARLVGRAYADESIRNMSKDEINPAIKGTKSLIICPHCGAVFSLKSGQHLKYCPKCRYIPNPILAELGASALAGFGLAAGWKGLDWTWNKIKGRKKNPWIYPWQQRKK